MNTEKSLKWQDKTLIKIHLAPTLFYHLPGFYLNPHPLSLLKYQEVLLCFLLNSINKSSKLSIRDKF